MQIFKIRDTNTGLYSTGGTNPYWNKKGKIWTSLGHIKNHFRQYQQGTFYREGRPIPDNWEIVVIGIEEKQAVPAKDIQ